MNKNILYAFAFLAFVLILFGAMRILGQSAATTRLTPTTTITQASSANLPSNSGNSSGSTAKAGALELFKNSPYFYYSYLVWTNNTPESSVAMAGFLLYNKTLKNGSVELTLSAKNYGVSKQINLSRTDSLYIIDTSLGEDFGSSDTSLADDGFVVVNSTGYVV